jgi:hypothetical protein
MSNLLIHKSAIEYNIQAPYYQAAATSESVSVKEMHRRAMFEVGNTQTGKDGRTYVSIDRDGEYQSCFVSQYSKIIEKNIEPKIAAVCRALHNKNYLTFGSCQGHSDSKLRWVGLVFNTKEQKSEFVRSVDQLELPVYWYDNHINTVERPCKKLPWYVDGLKLHIVWNSTHLQNASTSERREYPYTDSDLTNFWNLQMSRQYQHYESVILTIGKKIIADNCFEQLYAYLNYNESEIDKITKKLEEGIALIPEYYG